MDLSNNNLTGHIPLLRVRTYNFHLNSLLSLNLASNQFVGSIPDRFFNYLKGLQFLDLRDNNNLRAKSPDFFQRHLYVRPDYRVTIHVDSRSAFSCASMYLDTTGGDIHIDPSYYHYSLCKCDEGYYGYGNYCLPCMDGGLCQTNMQIHLQNNLA